ncbi:MAG: 50S ribosomal protein L16 [Planctomycetota bacterium]|nr:50S ribosomal protein L16 [Planctomycetota bacterium]
MIRGVATRGNYVAFGDYGLMAMEPAVVPARAIEAARVVCSRFLGSEGRYWVRVFPHKGFTATAAETRMGKGKGDVEYWAAIVKPGTILFEIGGVSEDMAREAFRRQAGKLPVKVRMVKRRATV